jgi:hypothetical protein
MSANRQGYASNFHLPWGMVMVFISIVIFAAASILYLMNPVSVQTIVRSLF